ncbi:DEAD-domain-containing protein [Zopfia rhizophila CBS 207.26]|uniref:RNA helicase n=1 Tax=Zopfia rhizophila CBS 207.26 TaxID=1314779 RepID=A0A6A6ECH0_9PEZI|nr:DEAD-domain-containing protein [Zopfia rhizophila CBS 207.26]
MGDIASDDEDAAAALAAAERRRDEINIEDAPMEDAPMGDAPTETQEEAGEDMDEDDLDPLDAFMAGLEKPALETNGTVSQGQAIFGDETEVNMEAVEGEDLLALANAKKKKRDIPTVDHAKTVYEPFRKAFYTEPAEVSAMSTEEVADLRLELDGIKVKPSTKGTQIPNPVVHWGQMGLSLSSLNVLTSLGYSKPTSIQSQAIPIAESGLDMIGVAKTGSGKTLAFGLPIIRHIADQRPLKASDGPIVLILAPTRELSVQIVRELKPFLKAAGLKAACAYGGAPIKDQIAEIKRGGIHVLCATPGRLIDLLTSNSGRVLSFKRITYVVLDEADRMLDMGFEPQVDKILSNIRPDRQTVLFSATFPKNMASLAKKHLTKPVEVTVGGRSVVAPEITQIVKVVPPVAEQKVTELLRHLGDLFQNDDDYRALVFVERQETAEELFVKVLKKGYPTQSIHGGKEQIDRTDAINDFKAGAIPVLIATSVAARGLDIPQLKLVVNYDCPTHLEDYVHRCGRTGRAGNTGTAVTFIENPGQERFAFNIVKALIQSSQEIPEDVQKMADEFSAKVKAGEEKWYGGFGGKGLDKLDAARELEKKREKRAYKTGDERDEQSEDEADIPVAKKDSPAPAAAKGPAASTTSKPAYLQQLDAEIIVNKTERPSMDSSKPMNIMDRVRMAASGVDGRLSRKGMIHHGQPIDNKGPDAGAFHSTIEINDFPQKARWAVTNRTNVAKILDATGTSITTKGTYYAPGKEPGESELPKLYILVEGETEPVVIAAIRELQRLLREGTLASNEADVRGPPGRYSVV